MTAQLPLVTTLYQDWYDEDVDRHKPRLFPVHIPGAEFYRGFTQRRFYGQPAVRPVCADFQEAMSLLSLPLSARSSASQGARAFLAQTNEASSFLVTWDDWMEPMLVHVGRLAPADEVLPPITPSMIGQQALAPEQESIIAEHNTKHAAFVAALRQAHYNEGENHLPSMQTLAQRPVVVCADNTIVIPSEGDYVAGLDGVIFARLETCRVEPTRSLPVTTQRGKHAPAVEAYLLDRKIAYYPAPVAGS